jgi:cobalt-zinc-cadmium efflux system outer membrane protein
MKHLFHPITHLLSIVILTIGLQSYSYADDMNDTDLSHLSMKKAEELFNKNNKEILAAKRAVEGSEADILTAGQKPNPSLGIGVSSFNLNRKQGNTNPNGSNSLQDQTLNSSLQLSQLFERGNKRDLRQASAENAAKASKFDFKDTYRQEKLILKSAYYDLLLAQQAEDIQTNTVGLYDKTLQAAELRFRAGDISSTDVARLRVDALRAKNDQRQSVADREKAQANLAYIIGEENKSSSIFVIDSWPSIGLSTSDGDTGFGVSDDTILNRRADIQAADERVRQADKNRQLAQSLKTHDVTVGVQYNHFPGQQPGAGEDTLGASVSIPIFSNYQYQGEIARAEVDYTSALEAKEQTQSAALGEITRARTDLQAATEKVQRVDGEMLTEAKKAADAAEFAYQHGAMGVTDLLDARRVLRALELDATSVRADYAKALAAWQAAINPEEAP